MIPEMIHPLGKHWQQPAREEILFDSDDPEVPVRIPIAAWEKLPAYDYSDPSGVYEGKMWRCQGHLRWYGASLDLDRCTIHTRKVVVCRAVKGQDGLVHDIINATVTRYEHGIGGSGKVEPGVAPKCGLPSLPLDGICDEPLTCLDCIGGHRA